MKETDHIEINGLFGLIYLRELTGMNLQMVDYLFDDEGHLCLWSNHDQYGSCSIQTLANMFQQVNTWQLMKHYILCDIKLISVNTILTSHTSMVYYCTTKIIERCTFPVYI